MTQEMKIEVLIEDGCTRKEAEKFLKTGTTVFESSDFEENFERYMDEWGVSPEEKEEYKKMITEKSPILDWGIVEKDGSVYYIAYIL